MTATTIKNSAAESMARYVESMCALCKQFGRTDLASRFVRSRTPLAEARRQLSALGTAGMTQALVAAREQKISPVRETR